MQKVQIYHTNQYQTFYRKIKSELLNFRGVQSEYPQDFQYFMVSIRFLHKLATLYISKVSCQMNCNHEKKTFFFFIFFLWKDITIPLRKLDVEFEE